MGWTEVPNTIVSITKETKNPIIGLTVGTVKGVLNAFARTASGAMDIVTTPIGQRAPDMKTQIIEVPDTTTTTASSKTASSKTAVKGSAKNIK
ncbi:MAG: hypothetical protein JW946_02570 [Candidatus Omnitrophica bacterium]|nr:hypothetical protein [Candidatus Omnitrophota bacterium]